MKVSILVACVALVAARDANAYVRTRNINGSLVRWPTSCVVLSPDARGDQSADAIDLPTFEATLDRAVTNWNNRMGACTFMKLGLAPATIALEAVSDGRPAVVFRSDVWGNGDTMYDKGAIGLTTVWSADREGDPTDGQIGDADIELNAVNFSFSVTPGAGTPRDGTKLADLENTLTHELGHVLGLGHTCWDHKKNKKGEDVQPTDNTGALVPSCTLPNGQINPELSTLITSATMYPYTTTPNSVSMRNLSQDDIRGVCDVYPSTDPALACYGYIEGTGCGVSRVRWPSANVAESVAASTSLLVLAAILIARRRRVMF